MKLPFEDNTFDIVINEAMLTMQTNNIKKLCLNEYYRVLKPGGVLLTHDICIIDNDETFIQSLSDAINVKVRPLLKDDWTKMFNESNFLVEKLETGKLTLLTPRGMLKDEGLINTIRIIKNAHKKENKGTFKKMFRFFKSNKDRFQYIVMISSKKPI